VVADLTLAGQRNSVFWVGDTGAIPGRLRQVCRTHQTLDPVFTRLLVSTAYLPQARGYRRFHVFGVDGGVSPKSGDLGLTLI